MKTDMRRIVERGYDEGEYASKYRSLNTLNARERRFLQKLTAQLPKQGTVLDFGCGVGIPYDAFLIKKGFSVTGIDISQKHINAAKKNVRKAKYIKGDFTKTKFPLKLFDAIVSFYAIFHIPRTEHKALLKRMHSLLKKDGLILVTLGINEMKMDVGDFVRSKMAWSSYTGEKNKELVEKAGLTILHEEEEHRGSEHHLWILAKKN